MTVVVISLSIFPLDNCHRAMWALESPMRTNVGIVRLTEIASRRTAEEIAHHGSLNVD